jgi:hypothetical protein
MAKSRPSTAAPSRPNTNTDYAGIIELICGPEYVSAGVSWLKYIGDKEKQGLKIISAVVKHRGQKRFNNKPKESITETANKSLGVNSFFKLTKENLEQYRKEYKQNMFRSQYGIEFGRKETDVADTGILKYKKFSELECCKVLNNTSKTFITRWSELGDDKSYISLAILVIKGIYTHWKQALPSQTVSHILHGPYNPCEIVRGSRMDKVATSFLMSKFSKVTEAPKRPQTTTNLLRRKGKDNIIAAKNKESKQNRGLDDVTQDRKKFLLRGNGNITGFFNDPYGNVSSYQAQFKPCKSTKMIQRSAGKLYTSSIMTMTPDPALVIKRTQKQSKLRNDLETLAKKMTQTDSALQRAMGRIMGYNDFEARNHMESQKSHAKIDGNNYRNFASNQFKSANNTPMPVRVQNLMK